MRRILVSSSLLCLLLLNGCAFAPFTNMYTGRSAGKGNVDLAVGGFRASTGSSNGAVPLGRLFVGVTEDFDLGVSYEVIDVGLLGRYSFINNQEGGVSFAAVAAYGSSMNGHYIYGGPVLSYKAGFWEPYLIARYNAIHVNKTDVELGNLGTATIGAYDFNYMYYTLGSLFWFSKGVGLGVEYSVFGNTKGVTMMSSGMVAAALNFRF